jgi:hypothetical protein
MDVFKVPPFDDDMRRPAGARTALEAYQAAAWRAPAATRFDSRPANDFAANDVLTRAEAVTPQSTPAPMELAPMPRWLVVLIGAIVAAILGGLLGGALAIY